MPIVPQDPVEADGDQALPSGALVGREGMDKGGGQRYYRKEIKGNWKLVKNWKTELFVNFCIINLQPKCPYIPRWIPSTG